MTDVVGIGRTRTELLCLAALGTVVVALAAPSTALSAHSKPSPRASADLTAAFKAAFHGSREFVDRSDPKFPITFNVTPRQLIRLGDRFVLIAGAATQENGHAQQGALSISYLRKSADGYAVTGSWPTIGLGSDFGQPPRWRLRQDLFASPAIEVLGQWDGMGCHVVSAQLIELAPAMPVERAKDIVTEYRYERLGDDPDDHGARRRLKGTIVSGEKDHDFRTVYTGSFRATVRYRRAGDRYEALPSREIPGC